MIRSRACIVTSVVFVMLSLNGCASRSRGPLFERKEPNVEAGIAAMRRNAPPEALAAFDRAAAQYPAAPEVPLDRGLALLATGTFARAREAFVRALGEGASSDLRAEALYDIGLTHHREADAPPAAGQEPDREHVMQSLRDAIEAYRRSLRTKPGQRDVAWNLEIALRRQHEEEEQQRQEQQQQEQEQQQQQQQANQDQQQQDQQQQQGDQNQQNQQQRDQNQQNQQASQDQQQQQDSDSSGQTPPPQPDAQQGAQADAQQRPEPSEPQPAEARPASAQPDSADSLTPEMRGMLDALDRGEGSLEEERARARAARENRRPLQDW